MQKGLEETKKVCAALMDLEKAYDEIHCEEIREVLTLFGVH